MPHRATGPASRTGTCLCRRFPGVSLRPQAVRKAGQTEPAPLPPAALFPSGFSTLETPPRNRGLEGSLADRIGHTCRQTLARNSWTPL